MANTFWRKPIIGGDLDAWGPYNDQHNENTYGINTCQLYNNAGTLTLTVGRVGIDDGTNEGVCHIDTVTTIALSGGFGIWQQIEMSVSGTNVTFAATDIAGATDPLSLPSGFTSSYNPEKGGFYINSNKRCVGIVWANGAGAIEGIVNTGSLDENYIGYSQTDDANDYPVVFNKRSGDLNERTYIHITEEYANNTNAGGFTSGAWRTRALNTTRFNNLSGASLAANQITLPAGTYKVRFWGTGYIVNSHKTRVYNTTDGATLAVGDIKFAGAGATFESSSMGQGIFTITASKVIELQHRCSLTNAVNGFGLAANFSEQELYADIFIERIKE